MISLIPFLGKTQLFFSQQPSFCLIILFFASIPLQFVASALNRFSCLYSSFHRLEARGIFTTSWFTQNIGLFRITLLLVRLFSFFRRSSVRCLELGSWEGLSSLFILDSLPNSKLYCVDTWAGADEHQSFPGLSQVKSRFMHNLAPYVANLSCIPIHMSTDDFFMSNISKPYSFDFCYIDASHSYDQSLKDLFNCISVVKRFSFVIFDDYLWNFYNDPSLNCGFALNVFLRTGKSRFVVPLFVSYQVVLFVI